MDATRKGRAAIPWCQQPFRLFFPLGWSFQLLGISPWVLYYWGLSDGYPGPHHVFAQIRLYETAFVVGFLGTALPRFWEAPAPRCWEVGTGAALLLVVAAALLLDARALAGAASLVLLLAFGAFLLHRLWRRRDCLPPAFALVGLGLASGLAGALAALWPHPALPGKALLEQGMLLLLLWGVMSYLGPRLLYGARATIRGGAARRRRFAALAFGLGVLASFWLEAKGSPPWGRLLRALLLAGYLLALGLYRRPQVRRLSLYMLLLALWCAPLGSALHAVWSGPGALHVLFMGSFGVATTLVAARVIAAHCDAEAAWADADGRLGQVCALLLSALLLRLAADMWPLHYFALLHASALLWLAGQVLWALRFLPLLRRVGEED